MEPFCWGAIDDQGRKLLFHEKPIASPDELARQGLRLFPLVPQESPPWKWATWCEAGSPLTFGIWDTKEIAEAECKRMRSLAPRSGWQVVPIHRGDGGTSANGATEQESDQQATKGD